MDPMTRMVRDRTAELQRVASGVRLERALHASNEAGAPGAAAALPVEASTMSPAPGQSEHSIVAGERRGPCGPCEPVTDRRAA